MPTTTVDPVTAGRRRWRAAVAAGLAVLTVGAAAGPAAALTNNGPRIGAPTPALLDAADQASFTRQFGNTASVAVTDLAAAPIVRAGDTRSPYAWSTSKVLIATTLVKNVGGYQRLTPTQRAQVTSAFTVSDNTAAASLFSSLSARTGGLVGASTAMTKVLRAGGDTRTVVSTVGRSTFSTYGQTLWPVEQQAQFMSSLTRNCLVDRASTAYLLDQMGHTTPSQRFGLGTVRAAMFKGGWGPDPDGKYLVRQMGLLMTSSGNRAAVAITARPPDGTYASGQALLGRVAVWLKANIGPAPALRSC